MSCADCTMLMAIGTLSRGARCWPAPLAIGVKPAKRPMITRTRKSCSTDFTSAHDRHDDDEAGQRADQHHLAAEAIGQPSEQRPQQAGDGRRRRGDQPRPHGDTAGIGDAQLAHVERHEGPEN